MPRASWYAACGLSSFLLALAPAAAAHSPHDIAYLVRPSPDFLNDKTVFACFTLTEHELLGRSRDAGRSWELYAPPMMATGLSRLVFSPGFAEDRTLFAASPTEGVFRSTDAGDTWEPIQEGLTDIGVNDLALAPDFVNNRTLLAATGSGCFLSVDGGDSWVESSAGLVPGPVMAVCFATDTVAFAAGTVMHRSDNGGRSWTALQSFAFPAASIAVSPDYANDSSVAVSFGRFGGGIEASLDGGDSWAPLTDGLTDSFVNELAFAPDGTFFAVTKEDGCFRGASLVSPLVLLDQGFEHHSDLTPNHYLGVGVSPAYALDQTVFVAAFEGLHRSQNGGELFEQMDVYSQRINRRVIVTSDATGRPELLMGNYGGGLQLARPTSPTPVALPGTPSKAPPAPGLPGAAGAGVAGASASWSLGAEPAELGWVGRSDGLGSLWTEVLERSPDYVEDGTLLLGHIGLWLSTDRGRSWSMLPVPPWPLPVRAAAFSPQWSSDQTLFVARQEGGVLRSNDGGRNWTPLSLGLPFGDSMSFIRLSPLWPTDPVGLISAKSGNVYRSSDGCNSWDACGGLPGTEVRALELSPDFASDRLALAGTVGHGVFRTVDAGKSWSRSNTGLPADHLLTIEGLALSPQFAADGTAFLSLLTGGVYRSTDHGQSWTQVGAGLPLAAPRVLGISDTYPQDGRLVLLTHDWAYQSLDQGLSFKRLPGFIRVDDGHPGVVYQGNWKSFASSGLNGPGHRLSAITGGATVLEFRGDSITWFTRTGPAEGSVHVFIDGQPAATVSLAQPSVTHQAPAFTRSFPAVGWHTIRVVNAGPLGSNPSGRVITDGFAYTF